MWTQRNWARKFCEAGRPENLTAPRGFAGQHLRFPHGPPPHLSQHFEDSHACCSAGRNADNCTDRQKLSKERGTMRGADRKDPAYPSLSGSRTFCLFLFGFQRTETFSNGGMYTSSECRMPVPAQRFEPTSFVHI